MPQKAEHTVHIHEGEATLSMRNGSPHWQLRYKANGKWTRTTTKKTKLADAKREAMEIIVRARVLEKEGLVVVNKRFKAVALLAIKRMDDELDNGQGKVTYKRYKQAINGYLIPYLGRHNIDKIDYSLLNDFSMWRKEQFGREPSQSAINTHNVALNRIFDEALMRGYITKSQVPYLQNKGVSSDRRPTFTLSEYIKIHRNLRKFTDTARNGNETLVRNVLRNYILILANTGIRAGTEAMNLKWKHIGIENVNGQRMLTMYVDGKTNPRKIYVKASVATYLNRIKELYDEIAELSFEKLIAKKVDMYVFRIDGKDATTRFGKIFGRFLEGIKLLKDKETDKDRTLYSFRHFYATLMITKGEVTTDWLADYMGTSPAMIKKHYKHLDLRDVAHKFVGKWTVDDELNKTKKPSKIDFNN